MTWTLQQLSDFKEQYPLRKENVNQVMISYYDINESNLTDTIIFLHGTTGSAEIFWLQLNELKKHFRVISVDIPSIDNIFEISKILRIFMKKRGVTTIFLLGTSYGGYLAQAFCSLYPTMIKGVILANTFHNTDYYNEKYNKLIKIQRFIPTFILKSIMKNSLKTIEHAMTRNYLLQQLQFNLNKKTLIARLKGFINNLQLEKTQIDNMLILETIEDPLVPPILQEALKNTYSNAKVHTFEKQANHFPYLTRSKQYNQVLIDFLINQ
jgi:pimeloyl-ACP methyl ester carboxylesterase